MKGTMPSRGRQDLFDIPTATGLFQMFYSTKNLAGVSSLLASLCWKKRVVLGHTSNTLQHMITKKSHAVLSKWTTLCWAALIAILGHVWSVGSGLHTPRISSFLGLFYFLQSFSCLEFRFFWILGRKKKINASLCVCVCVCVLKREYLFWTVKGNIF